MKRRTSLPDGVSALNLLAGYFWWELHETSLEHAPALLQGWQGTPPPQWLQGRVLEIQQLRAACKGLHSLRSLRLAAQKASNGGNPSGDIRHFDIDPATLTIRPLTDLPPADLMLAIAELRQPPAHALHGMRLPESHQSLALHFGKGADQHIYPIRGLPEHLPPPKQYPAAAPQRKASLAIAWDDLLQMACEMDAIDQEQRVARPGNWLQRLRATRLQSLSDDGKFLAEDHLQLSGIKHLLGLPGAGKTTLLLCLLRYCGLRGLRVATFFPTVAMSLQYRNDLERYGVKAGMLIGRSRQARLRHQVVHDEGLARGDPLGGFALRDASTPFVEGVCAIHGLTGALPERFGHRRPPCNAVWEGKEPHLCPVWNLCGLQRAASRAPDCSVLLGHAAALDTPVPVHTSPHRWQHFELLAETFDLVVFDEADQVQQHLDGMGLMELQLTGSADSLHWKLHEHWLRPMAEGAALTDKRSVDTSIALATNAFERLCLQLLRALGALPEAMGQELAQRLLTVDSLIHQWWGQEVAPEVLQAWTEGAQQAWSPKAQGGPSSPLAIWMEKWLGQSADEQLSVSEAQLLSLLPPPQRTEDLPLQPYRMAVLLGVTFTTRALRSLSGLVEREPDAHSLQAALRSRKLSPALQLRVPASLLNDLEGVRLIRHAPGQAGVPAISLQYLRYSSLPRMLMLQLHTWSQASAGSDCSGPAVLLTSATSYFPESPTHHVLVEPHYVLQASSTEPTVAPGQHSVYAFRPIANPDTQKPSWLRFSGAGGREQALIHLKKMVHHLLQGGPTESVLARDCAEFDVRHGVARRAGLVVNSYAQVQLLKDYIDRTFPEWRSRVWAVVKEVPRDALGRHGGAGYITPTGAEHLGDQDDWQVLIFAAGSLGRSVNIVFTEGPRRRDAVLGTLYFLTRPHPSPDDLGFVTGLAARATAEHVLRNSTAARLEDLHKEHAQAKRALMAQALPLLRHPLRATQLPGLQDAFAADRLVPLHQTIGRAMRNGCAAHCVFVDWAWAERSPTGEPDDAHSSLLVLWRTLLHRGTHHANARTAALYRSLFSAYLEPLSRVQGLLQRSDAPPASTSASPSTSTCPP